MSAVKHTASLVMALLTFSIMANSHAQEAPVYRVGVVPQFDSRKIFDIWTPIIAQLQARTGYRFELVGSPDIPSFEQQLGQQAFDFAYMNPYHYIVASSNYAPILRDISTPLQGIIVVRKDGAIKNLKDLDGKKVAFPAPNALAASLLTRSHLSQLGIKYETQYVKTHTSVYLNVALGQSDAGGGVQQTLEEQPASVQEQLRVIDRTISVPSHPIVASNRLPAAVRDQVRAAFLAIGQTPEGKAMLLKIPYDQIGKASAEEYGPLKLMGLVKFYVPN